MPSTGKISFVKTKLNSDSSLGKLPPGDSRYILNSIVHASEDGNVGDIENIKGFTCQTQQLPAGINTTIGKCRNNEDKGVIWFLYNSTGKHCILYYNPITGAAETTILQQDQPNAGVWDTNLNFSLSHPIQAVVVGDNLIWTDGLNSVRQVSIEKATHFTAGAGSPIYTTITESILNLIKIPPFSSPSVVYDTDTDFEKNHLRGKLFQFAYRFVYDDWGESVYSDISDTPLPEGNEYWYGEIRHDLDKNNLIKIQVQTGNEDVTQIDIIGREGDIGAWFRVVSVIKADLSLSDNDQYVYDFYNNASVEEISQIEAGELFSYIPTTADSLALLEDNRIILGGITEGEEKEDISVGFYTFKENLTTSATGGLQEDYALAPDVTLTSNGTHLVDFYWELDESTPSYVPVEGHLIKITMDGTARYYEITAAMAGAPNFDVYIDFIEEKLENDFLSGIRVSETFDDILTIIRDDYPEEHVYFDLDIQVYAASDATEILKYSGFKAGAHHPFCLIYYDGARRTNGAHTDDDCVVYVDFPTEQTDKTNTNYKHNIKWGVGHIPPIGATHWQWGYAGNSSISWFVQYVIGNRNLGGASTGIYTDTDKHVTYIDIEPLNTLNDWAAGTDPWHLHSSIDPYVFEEGDRIRFITSTPLDDTNGVLGVVLTGANKYIDLEILGIGTVDDAGINTIITEELETATYIGNATTKVNDRSLAEIYRPKKTSDYTIYKTFGEVYEISNAGEASRKHKGIIHDQEATQDIESSTDASPIVITVTGHGYAHYDIVLIEGHETNTNANGLWEIIVINNDTFRLENSLLTGDGAGGATGTVCIPATGIFSRGDVYHISRVFNIDIDTALVGDHPVLIESQHYSDFYDSDVYTLGRPMIELDDDFRKGTKSSLLRYGGIYIPNTKINNLAKFDYDNYTTRLRIQDGTINKLDFNGEILKVFQDHKKTSVYIGKTALYKADGTTDLVTTDAVIGSIRPGIGDEGTVFPGSVVHNGTHTYFYDIYKGEVVRDAYNGMFSISDYDMKKYFSDKSKALLTSGVANVDVQAVFDEKYGLYIITFTDSVTPANNGTIGFHEASNSWISFYSFVPEMYASYGEYMMSFKSGYLYTHNDNEKRCYFYGTQYTQEVDIVFNAGIENVKTFKTIAVYSNKKWTAPESGDILIPATATYPEGMSSRLKAPHFKDIEGVFRADFLQNELTTTGSPLQKDLISGDDLRGSSIRVNLKNSETVAVVLREIEIGFDLSV